MNKLFLPLLAGIGASLAIGLLSYMDQNLSDVALLMAPFGATVVIVFGLPDSPLAQAKNVIFGHLITAFIGIFFVQFIGVSPLYLAMATGLGVSAMLLTKTTHPPAGANPILLVTPVLIGAVVIVLLGKLMKTAKIKLTSQSI
ncbi:HPP family protein [Vibrio sp. 2-Bac 85]